MFGGAGVLRTPKGERRTESRAANVKIRGRGLHQELGLGPEKGRKERSGVWDGRKAYFASNLVFRLQLAL